MHTLIHTHTHTDTQHTHCAQVDQLRVEAATMREQLKVLALSPNTTHSNAPYTPQQRPSSAPFTASSNSQVQLPASSQQIFRPGVPVAPEHASLRTGIGRRFSSRRHSMLNLSSGSPRALSSGAWSPGHQMSPDSSAL